MAMNNYKERFTGRKRPAFKGAHLWRRRSAKKPKRPFVIFWAEICGQGSLVRRNRRRTLAGGHGDAWTTEWVRRRASWAIPTPAGEARQRTPPTPPVAADGVLRWPAPNHAPPSGLSTLTPPVSRGDAYFPTKKGMKRIAKKTKIFFF